MKKVLFASSESVPFIKTGGLADVVGSLPKYFNKAEYDVRVILPKYSCMAQKWKDMMQYKTHFYMDFAESLSLADEVVLCDIYPAREQPIPGVASKLIYDNLRTGIEKSMIQRSDVLNYVEGRDFDVLVVLGAGDLDNLMPQITEIITKGLATVTSAKLPRMK